MSRKKPILVSPFNPLDKTNLGESVAEAMLRQPVRALPPDDPFVGAGDTLHPGRRWAEKLQPASNDVGALRKSTIRYIEETKHKVADD